MKKHLLILAATLALVVGLTHTPVFTSGSRVSAQTTDIQDGHRAQVRINYTIAVHNSPNWDLYDIPWNVVDWNVDGEYNAANPERLTAQMPGFYLIRAQMGFRPGFVGDGYVGLFKNDTATHVRQTYAANGSVNVDFEVSTVDYLGTGDYYTVKAGLTCSVCQGVGAQTDYDRMSFSMSLLSH